MNRNPLSELPFTTDDILCFLRAKQCSFLTVTLKPKLYKFSSITQLELTNNDLYNTLYRCSENYYIVAEHTQQGNVHYHAVVNFRDKYQKVLCMNMLKRNRSLGFLKLDDEIQSQVRCAEYMTKDLYDTLKVFTSVRGRRPSFVMSAAEWSNITEIKPLE